MSEFGEESQSAVFPIGQSPRPKTLARRTPYTSLLAFWVSSEEKKKLDKALQQLAVVLQELQTILRSSDAVR
jgi:hypothetical protein